MPLACGNADGFLASRMFCGAWRLFTLDSKGGYPSDTQRLMSLAGLATTIPFLHSRARSRLRLVNKGGWQGKEGWVSLMSLVT